MALLVTSNAMMKCSFGMVPCPFMATGVNKVLSSMPIGSLVDATLTNLPSFGMCSSMVNPSVAAATAAALGVLTPMSCTAIFTGWLQSSTKVFAQNQLVLTSDSKLLCAYGGVITIIQPGQTKVQVA